MVTPLPKEIQTVERKVYFFRADLGLNPDNTPASIHPKELLVKLGTLSFDKDERYYFLGSGDALCALEPFEAEGHDALRFCKVRRTGLPQLERRGNVTDLDLEIDQGLIEPIHMVFFPDNVIGAEVYREGPRITQFPAYVKHCLGERAPEFSIEALLQPETAAELDQFGEIRLLDIILSRQLYSMSDVPTRFIGRMFDNVFGMGSLEHAAVALRFDPTDRGGILERAKEALIELAERIDPGERNVRLRIRGVRLDTDSVAELDLLEQRIVSTQLVERVSERGRAVVPEVMFGAIIAAYRQNRETIIGQVHLQR